MNILQNNFFVSEPFLYAPGFESIDDFKLWAHGEKDIPFENTSPSLSYTEPLFRRRLSQLSKMTVEVIHQLLETAASKGISNLENTKIVFVSFRGEIDREFKLNKSIIEDQMILPAGFSLSVFNAPVALATIACKHKAGYNTVFPSEENFRDGFLCAAAPILCGAQDKIIFVYADELIPECYKDSAPENRPPVAFATIISNQPDEHLCFKEYSTSEISTNVYEFLKNHIQKFNS